MSTLFTVHTSSLHTQVMYITECFFPPSQYIVGLVLHCIPYFITQGLLLNSVLHITALTSATSYIFIYIEAQWYHQ